MTCYTLDVIEGARTV